MIRFGMRPQKTQLPGNIFKWLNTSGTFEPGQYIQAGYTNFDLMIVGASGGRSGRAGSPGHGYVHPSGGGGGAGLRKIGLLSSLPVVCEFVAGVKGTNGVDAPASTSYKFAGDGNAGGSSKFGLWTAEGGQGGGGGHVRIKTNGDSEYGESTGGFPGLANLDVGTWDNATLTGSGGIGGGGASSEGEHEASFGRAGSIGQPDNIYRAIGDAAGTQIGGTGGGTNIAPATGGAYEPYGTGVSAVTGSGVVYLRLS